MREMIEEMVDDALDSEGEVQISGLTFRRSYIVRELDPIAYRVMCNDFADAVLEDLRYELECLDEESDADEVADLRERIALLEDL